MSPDAAAMPAQTIVPTASPAASSVPIPPSVHATGAAGTTRPIPYREDDNAPVMQGAGSLLVAVLLLFAVVIALRAAKRKGLLAAWIATPRAHTSAAGLRLENTLRLSAKTTVHVLCDGTDRHLLIESSMHTRILALPRQAPEPDHGDRT